MHESAVQEAINQGFTTPLIGSLIVFAVTYVLIITEKLDRTAAAVIGAGAVIMLHFIPHREALSKIDMDVMFLLVGMMTVVNILSETGLFEWVAVFIAQKAKGSGLVILAGLLVATAVLSALLDNVTTVVLIAPITILITQILGIPTVPFLILEALFSNIGGTATLVGDPPNILIGSKAGLTFNDFVMHLTPIVLVCMVVVLIGVCLIYGRYMKVSPGARARIMKARPDKAITDPFRLKRGLIVFGLILLGFCFSHSLHVEPGIIALCGALIMVVVCRTSMREAMEKVEWETIFFLIGLFMLVGALEYNGLFQWMGDGLFSMTRDNLFLAALALMWSGAILSAAFGNIPVVMAMIPLVHTMTPAFGLEMGIEDPELIQLQIAQPLWWALALGTCLGGNGTLFGAAANVVVAQISTKNGYKVTFWDFTRFGFPVMMVTLVLSSFYIYLRYFAFAS